MPHALRPRTRRTLGRLPEEHPCSLVACAGALLAATLALAAASDRPSSDPAPSGKTAVSPTTGLVESVTSELVLIETYVTDGSGQPVRGLTKDDFILEVGGLRRSISSAEFREYPLSTDAAPGSVSSAPGPPPSAGGPWPRRFVLFFEDNTSSPLGLGEARQAAERFLASGLLATDEVALASYDQRLRLLQDFTTDRDALRLSLATSVRDASRFSSFALERSQHFQEIMNNPSVHLVQALCEMEEMRYRESLKAAATIADSLAGWRGYKAIVFMGDGIPNSPMQEIYEVLGKYSMRHPMSAPPLFDSTCTLGDEIKDLVRTAGADGVTIHTIQTRGITAGSQYAGKIAFQRGDALLTLALNTAGVSSTTNDFVEAFKGIEAASHAFYVLGYVPLEPADGRYQHIIVRCRRPNVQLRYRRGFTRLPPEEAHARTIEAAYSFPQMFSGLGAEIETIPGPRTGGRRVVDIVVHAPLGKILFLPEAGVSMARVTVGFVAVDGHRTRTFETSRSLRVKRPEGQEGVAGVDVYCRASLPLDAQSISAVIQDEQSGTIAGTATHLDEASLSESALAGLSLYSLAERSAWIELPSTSGKPVVETAEVTIGPALKNRFTPGEAIEAGFRLPTHDPAATIAIQVEIRCGSEVVRSRTSALGSPDPDSAAKLALPVEGLADGDYTLSVRAFADDREFASGSRTFRIAELESEAPGAAPSP